MIRRRKNLGQNFLKDRRALDRIASVLEIQSGDVVVEIGPGHGELTRRLLEQNPQKLIAIERDSALINQYLEELVEKHPNLEVLEGDALVELPNLASYRLKGAAYKLVGNIPYYITGYLLRIIGGLERKPAAVVLTLQKEVALRICANLPHPYQGNSGQGKMNILAASVQAWGSPEIVRYISRKSFRPAPRVDSAVIKITPSKEPVGSKYYSFIKVLFSKPRKTILNNLKSLGLPRETLEEKLFSVILNPKARPQDLSIDEIKKLSSLFTRN